MSLPSSKFRIIQTYAPTVLSGGLTRTKTFELVRNQVLQELSAKSSLKRFNLKSPVSWIRSNTILVFFPRGYPYSVTPSYYPFMKWHFIASICGTINGVLGTQSLLTALGMGAGALPIAATLNWIIKDGLGLLGGVIYTSLFSGRFDSEPKRYRFKASLAFQTATICELLTPLVPNMFLILASTANIAKNIAWLTMSGCRAQMHQSFCLRDNLGDITAKAGSQSTAAGLVGTGLGAVVGAMVGGSVETSLAAFVPLSAVSLYSLYLSNKAVTTKSFNIQRAELIFYSFIKSNEFSVCQSILKLRFAI